MKRWKQSIEIHSEGFGQIVAGESLIETNNRDLLLAINKVNREIQDSSEEENEMYDSRNRSRTIRELGELTNTVELQQIKRDSGKWQTERFFKE